MLPVCVSDILDAGLHAYHHSGYAGGSNFGMEVDDTDLCHAEYHPHLPL